MYRCPKCGRYMLFRMEYNCGIPIVSWYCYCGYDTSKIITRTSNRTEIITACPDSLMDKTAVS